MVFAVAGFIPAVHFHAGDTDHAGALDLGVAGEDAVVGDRQEVVAVPGVPVGHGAGGQFAVGEVGVAVGVALKPLPGQTKRIHRHHWFSNPKRSPALTGSSNLTLLKLADQNGGAVDATFGGQHRPVAGGGQYFGSGGSGEDGVFALDAGDGRVPGEALVG